MTLQEEPEAEAKNILLLPHPWFEPQMPATRIVCPAFPATSLLNTDYTSILSAHAPKIVF